MLGSEYWGILSSFAATILVVFTLLKYLLKRAKPKILAIENCSIQISETAESIYFELTIRNDGEKPCSVVVVGLLLPNNLQANLNEFCDKYLPFEMGSYSTEKIKVYGFSGDTYGSRPLSLSKENVGKLLPAKLLVKFDTEKIIIRKIDFAITEYR